MSIRTVGTVNAAGDTALAGEPAPPGAVALEIGQIFRGLKIRGLLGSGGMGIAYLASHASLKTRTRSSR